MEDIKLYFNIDSGIVKKIYSSVSILISVIVSTAVR